MFEVTEVSIAELRAALESGQTTAVELVQAYLARIDAYERVSGRRIRLEVDGGVKVDNIAEIARAGADAFVAGSAIYGTPDYKATIDAMRAELARD